MDMATYLKLSILFDISFVIPFYMAGGHHGLASQGTVYPANSTLQ